MKTFTSEARESEAPDVAPRSVWKRCSDGRLSRLLVTDDLIGNAQPLLKGARTPRELNKPGMEEMIAAH
jgi:hypothetical protein